MSREKKRSTYPLEKESISLDHLIVFEQNQLEKLNFHDGYRMISFLKNRGKSE